ncbi:MULTISPECIES: chemotaxis protein CheD [unclassified Fusibacter]|uniref:chemotaxis protein CheD n=1 Tax=unclassified Fusibacter TaxID=2624464 RepID=UPI00101311A0|nr:MULTISPECIES: chemotaxis protein CheD [unclassified Fusibacter]MCK8058784.1 chemotaxis protein CheD [Fusibacter sp. A2]NPE21858.1 chemotaxis protein CheD [Fusibacter sp. A1]RXV61430.1 chemotaxis protein CheD [Fusibacter sp. A1]
MRSLIKVGMADLKVTKNPGVLTTLGLGSCIGICLYDPISKVAGMAHIMLPDSTAIRNNANPAKFADTAMVIMLDDMVKNGAVKSRLVGKIAGGAQMFSFSSKNDMMKIGERNAEAVRSLLREFKIPLKADDTGGNFGRTIEFDSDNGALLIKTIGHGIKEL